MNKLLSICIPTYNRARLLKECLESFLPQVIKHEIPIYVSDNASVDGTTQMLKEFRTNQYPHLFMQTNPSNLGADRNIAIAVGMSTTRFVWLFGDDDIVLPGAVDAVLAMLGSGIELVIVNASAWTVDLGREVDPRRITLNADRTYEVGQHSQLLCDGGTQTACMSSLVIKTSHWIKHKDQYYPADFPHFGVAFSYAPYCRAAIIAFPYVKCRLGGSTWSRQMFKVLMVQWPMAVWGLGSDYDDAAKASLTIRNRLGSLRHLFAARAMGLYGPQERDLVVEHGHGRVSQRWMANLILFGPSQWCRAFFRVYLLIMRPEKYLLYLYELQIRSQADRAASPTPRLQPDQKVNSGASS